MQRKRAQCQADSSVGLQNHSEEGQRTQEDYLWQVIEYYTVAQLGIIEGCYLTITADGANCFFF